MEYKSPLIINFKDTDSFKLGNKNLSFYSDNEFHSENHTLAFLEVTANVSFLMINKLSICNHLVQSFQPKNCAEKFVAENWIFGSF